LAAQPQHCWVDCQIGIEAGNTFCCVTIIIKGSLHQNYHKTFFEAIIMTISWLTVVIMTLTKKILISNSAGGTCTSGVINV